MLADAIKTLSRVLRRVREDVIFGEAKRREDMGIRYVRGFTVPKKIPPGKVLMHKAPERSFAGARVRRGCTVLTVAALGS
jgi:hypothetical protein